MRTHEFNSPPHDQNVMMNTMTSCVNKVVKQGYTDTFKITDRGLLSCARNRYFRPEQIRVINFYRFEGQSDPADNSIMYVIETSDGLCGTLIDAYGAYADSRVNNFMKAVEDIRKKE